MVRIMLKSRNKNQIKMKRVNKKKWDLRWTTMMKLKKTMAILKWMLKLMMSASCRTMMEKRKKTLGTMKILRKCP